MLVTCPIPAYVPLAHRIDHVIDTDDGITTRARPVPGGLQRVQGDARVPLSAVDQRGARLIR